MARHAGLQHRHGDDLRDADIVDPVIAKRLEVLFRRPFVERDLAGEAQHVLPHRIESLRVLEIDAFHHVVGRHLEMLDQMGLVIVDAARTIHFGGTDQRNGVQQRLRQRPFGHLQALGQRPPALEQFDIEGEETPSRGQEVRALGLADIVENRGDLIIREIGLHQLNLVHLVILPNAYSAYNIGSTGQISRPAESDAELRAAPNPTTLGRIAIEGEGVRS